MVFNCIVKPNDKYQEDLYVSFDVRKKWIMYNINVIFIDNLKLSEIRRESEKMRDVKAV